MKTTLDLPDDLVNELQSRAVDQGRPLEDIVANLLREGLVAVLPPGQMGPPQITTDSATGLPVIRCHRSASELDEMTPARVTEILIEQDSTWHHEARG